jgi:hypothetical protein
VRRFHGHWLKKRFEEDRGAALALVASSMVLIMGMAAFGSDLAWFYLNASRVQRAADAAALGGVVWMPASPGTADSTALDIAFRNGYDDGDPDVTVTPATIPGAPNELEVTVRDVVPTFFAKILGFNTMAISRTARAEYIPPLRLGSPSNIFGNDPSCYATNVDCRGNFWANIHGRNTDTRMGDAYSSFCADGGGSSNGCAMSPAYRNTGYLYGVVPNGNNFTLQTLDMAFNNENGGVPNGDPHRTGDHNNFCGSFNPSCVGPTAVVNVFAPDPTPLDLSDNGAPACSKTYPPQPQINPDSDPPFTGPPPPNWTWDTVCSVNTSSSPNGIWVVQVVNTSSNVNTSGLNRYSIRTSTGDFFGLGDFSMFNNSTATQSNFYLAEVPDYYAGKTFVVELYDPGDSNAGGDIKLITPAGGVYGSCEMFTRNEVTDPWVSTGTRSPCQFTALNNGGANDYNGEWVKLESVLPPPGSYIGGWWRIEYDFVGGVQDTTTWRAYMIGNPIHLIPAP